MGRKYYKCSNSKSQAALEFLTTYVWAFIIIAVTILAFYYFGVFDFGKYLPQECTFPSQFRCADFSLKSDQVILKISNNLGENICIVSAEITNDAAQPISCTNPPLSSPPSYPQGSCQDVYSPDEFEWSYPSDKEIIFSLCSGGGYQSGERAELKITLKYYAINTPTKPIHTINGKVNGRVA